MKPPRNDGLAVPVAAVELVKKNLTKSETRLWAQLDKESSRRFRRFWVRILKDHGYSNSNIAKAFGLSESTIRIILKRA